MPVTDPNGADLHGGRERIHPRAAAEIEHALSWKQPS